MKAKAFHSCSLHRSVLAALPVAVLLAFGLCGEARGAGPYVGDVHIRARVLSVKPGLKQPVALRINSGNARGKRSLRT